MLPMLLLVLVTLLLISAANAWLAARRVRHEIETQLGDIAQTLSQSAFPLTASVLTQMRGLSGVEFLVADEQGILLASSGGEDVPREVLTRPRRMLPEEITLSDRVDRGGATYFHVAVLLERPLAREQRGYLHFFYPEAVYRRARRDAVLPPFLLGFSALVVVAVFSLAISRRVTRPIRELRDGLERIAAGAFQPLPVPRRDDELRDLILTVNQVAATLARYEQQVRRAERLRTLDQLGGGMAHQLRNAVTGCRMAVDLHRFHCSHADDEELVVALQQLEQMEGYLRRFLSLGRQEGTDPIRVDLGEVVDRIVPLVELRCRHLGIELQWHRSPQPYFVRGNGDALAQLLLNLLTNALEAAAEGQHAAVDSTRTVSSGWVRIKLLDSPTGRVRIEVTDSGPGPSEQVQENLFEPLVSGKRDGVGLGLSLAREIAQSHHGTLNWERRDGRTCFHVELPRGDEDQEDGHVDGGG